MRGSTNANPISTPFYTGTDTQNIPAYVEYGFGLLNKTIPKGSTAVISVQTTGKITAGRLAILGIANGINIWLSSANSGSAGDTILSGIWVTHVNADTSIYPKFYHQGDAAVDITANISISIINVA